MFEAGKGNMKTPEAVKPILFSCPSCAGNLEVDGSDRVIKCKYCNSEIYLPDDLWFRMHPVEVVERWYIVLDEKKMSDKPAGWCDLSDAAADKDGNLYLATADDNDNFLLWSMGPDFKTRWKVPGLEFSSEDTRLAVTDDGRIYLWDKNKHSLLILSAKNGSIIKKLNGREATLQEPIPFNMMETSSLAVDTDGTLIVLKNKYILRFSPDGKKLPAWGGTEEAKKKKGFLSRLFGGDSGEPEEERYPPDVVEMKNRPLMTDTEYTFVTLGWDSYIYFMEATSASDASVAKYDRNGRKLWNSIVPLDRKESRPCIDKNGFVYVLGEKNDKYYLVRLNQSTMKWETLLKDIREGGNLYEVENLAVTPDGSRVYCLEYNNRMRVFDSGLNMIYISGQSKKDDEELAEEHRKKVENDEEFK
jgi:WD40 repeat protein